MTELKLDKEEKDILNIKVDLVMKKIETGNWRKNLKRDSVCLIRIMRQKSYIIFS